MTWEQSVALLILIAISVENIWYEIIKILSSLIKFFLQISLQGFSILIDTEFLFHSQGSKLLPRPCATILLSISKSKKKSGFKKLTFLDDFKVVIVLYDAWILVIIEDFEQFFFNGFMVITATRRSQNYFDRRAQIYYGKLNPCLDYHKFLRYILFPDSRAWLLQNEDCLLLELLVEEFQTIHLLTRLEDSLQMQSRQKLTI